MVKSSNQDPDLKERYQQLRESQQVQSELVGKLLHDLRTPLTALLVEVDLLRSRCRKAAPPDKLEESLSRLTQDCEDLNSLLQKFCDRWEQAIDS